MSETEPKEPAPPPPALEDIPEDEQLSLVGEFWLFLRENKKWWLLPLVVIFLFIGVLILGTSTPLAPFLYSFL